MRWSVGAAYTFLDKGLVSVDYEQVNYADTRLVDKYTSYDPFVEENNLMAGSFNNAHILRLGAELRISDRMALRGGYQNYSPAVKGGVNRNAYSAGIGFNLSPAATLDFAWTKLAVQADTFQLYDDYSSAVTVPEGRNMHSLSKLVCTLGIKF